jgi:hypothetical protein
MLNCIDIQSWGYCLKQFGENQTFMQHPPCYFVRYHHQISTFQCSGRVFILTSHASMPSCACAHSLAPMGMFTCIHLLIVACTHMHIIPVLRCLRSHRFLLMKKSADVLSACLRRAHCSHIHTEIRERSDARNLGAAPSSFAVVYMLSVHVCMQPCALASACRARPVADME